MSWRKYGGTKNLENFNNITVNNIVTDSFTVRNAILNLLRIEGDLLVNGTVTVRNDLIIKGNIFVDSEFGANLVTFDILRTREGHISENFYVQGNIIFDPKQDSFLYATNSLMGLNNNKPTATLDISGIYQEGINVWSTQPINKNVLSRNNNNQGIVLLTDPRGAYIEFFNETPIPASNNNIVLQDPNYVADASLSYQKGGYLVFNTKQDVKITSNMIINKKNAGGHMLGESAIIYDIPAGTYFYNAYQQVNNRTGNALTLVANDNSANTFLNITTPNKQGAAFGGGVFPYDLSRNMAIVGTLDASGSLTPHQIIVSGNSTVKARAVAGFNTFAPPLDHYVVDINGPLKITNGEITTVAQPSYQVLQIGYSKNRAYNVNNIVVGTPFLNSNLNNNYYILNSTNAGQTWSQLPILNSAGNPAIGSDTILNINLYGSTAYNANFWLISGDSGTLLYSLNAGGMWGPIGGLPTTTIYSCAVIDYTSIQRFFVAYNNSFVYFDALISTFNSSNYTVTSPQVVTTSITASPTVSCDVSGNYFFIAGGNTVKVYQLSTLPGGSPTTHTAPSGTYNAICAFSPSYAVAVGANIISYTTNSGATWTDIVLSGVTLNSVFIYDTVNAVAVGNAGSIYYTINGSYTWQPVPLSILNASGIAARILNASTNLSSVYMPDINTMVVSSVITAFVNRTTAGNTKFFYLYLPNLFNLPNTQNTVLDICGNMAVTGSMVLSGQINQF
jgi:hypothetical protein